MNQASRRNASGLIYYMHDSFAAFRFQLAGDLSQENTAELDQARQTASSVFAGRSLIVDLTGIGNIDDAGRELIGRWHGLGAQLVVTTQEAKARIQSWTGVPFRLLQENSEGSQWLPGRPVVWLLAAAFVLLSAVTVVATSRGRDLSVVERNGSSVPLTGRVR
jgi:ABC-type transporter Mla MlaB component